MKVYKKASKSKLSENKNSTLKTLHPPMIFSTNWYISLVSSSSLLHLCRTIKYAIINPPMARDKNKAQGDFQQEKLSMKVSSMWPFL